MLVFLDPCSEGPELRVGEAEDPSRLTAPTNGVMPPGREPLVLRWLLERGRSGGREGERELETSRGRRERDQASPPS